MTGTTTVRLRRFAGKATLAQATATASSILQPRDVCFVSSPGSWQATTVAASGDLAATNDAFDVRWFGANGEVRWIRDGESGDCAALVTADQTTLITDLTLVDEREFEYLVRTYACWPVLRAEDDGSLLLKDGRTPVLRVPVSPGEHAGDGDALVVAWELLDDVGHGNIRVIDQLLRGIERRDKGER